MGVNCGKQRRPSDWVRLREAMKRGKIRSHTDQVAVPDGSEHHFGNCMNPLTQSRAVSSGATEENNGHDCQLPSTKLPGEKIKRRESGDKSLKGTEVRTETASMSGEMKQPVSCETRTSIVVADGRRCSPNSISSGAPGAQQRSPKRKRQSGDSSSKIKTSSTSLSSQDPPVLSSTGGRPNSPTGQPDETDTGFAKALFDLTPRAMQIVNRVDCIVRRCEGFDPIPATDEEHAMYAIFAALRHSPVGQLFLSHPEVSLSNRSSVICIPEFHQDEMIDGYRLRAAYNAGTIGRSYFATRDIHSASGGSSSVSHSGLPSEDSAHDAVFRILKVVSFVLRRSLIDDVTADQRVLVNVLHSNVLRIVDVLNDETKENMIVITNYHPKGSIGAYAGQLQREGDKLRRIMTEVAVGLRILHSHKAFHHNLKLDNVLESHDGHFCISDAGFWRLFASQCSEDLVFNGELAALPPEVFDETGPYATGDIDTVAPAGVDGAAAVDVWGFGVLMYRLAYGADPIEIAECSYAEVRERLLHFELHFPDQPSWPFAADLVEVIVWCMQKDPAKRPTIVRLLRHLFFKEFLMGSSSNTRNISMTGSFVSGAQGMNSSLGDRTMSGQSFRAVVASGSGGVSTSRSQQRNGYQVDAFLGEGRFSETLLVHLRRNPAKQFAFKIIYKSILKELRQPGKEEWSRAVRRQLVVCRKVSHPNIMTFLDIVEDKKVDCFVVQEYVKGGPIHTVPPLKNEGSAPHLQDFLVDVLSGLVHLHDNDVVHLSLSPSNIFFSEETQHYRIADYGPLFVTIDLLTASLACGAPLYTLPEWLRKESPLNGAHVDVFCVGLLAASVLPEVYNHVWNELRETVHDCNFSVEAVLAAVRDPLSRLPLPLVSFIEDALLGKLLSTRAALQHRYFVEVEVVQKLPKQVIDVTAEELRGAVHAKPENRDEARMLEVLAQDPFQECQMLTSIADPALTFESGTDTSLPAGFNPDRCVTLTFTGEQLTCGQCGAELTVALYQCPDCSEDCVRCGKCAVGDHHARGHTLIPFVIYTIEHTKEEINKAVLVHPSEVPDVHALETLEMRANFPAGSLTTQLTTHRVVERSVALRSICGTSFTKGAFSDMDSVVHMPDDVNEQSTSTTINARSSISFRGLGMASATGFNSNNGAGGAGSGIPTSPGLNFNRVDFITPKEIGSLSLPPVPKFSLMKGKETKKLALPKAEEVEDDDWPLELERVRTNNLTELLLYSYGLDSVPPEVYCPPLLQVVVLDLSQNSLTSLPHELSFLIHLRKLVVSYNKLTELPDSLGNLTELESVDASHNTLTELPQSFMYLSALTSAALDYNDFGQIPECLLDILSLVAPSSAAVSAMDSYGVNESAGENHRRSSSSVVNLSMSPVTGASISISRTRMASPKLKVIYLAANARITTFPALSMLERFDDLTIALDNEPSLYTYYNERSLDTALPGISINWNKIYPDAIIPNLYCGSLRSAQSQMVYRKLHITYLLTVGRQLVPVPPEGGHHKVIVVDDIPGADIRSSFQEAVDFIEESQQSNSGCLVHCFAGLSRSATTVIAYLMMKKDMRLDEAYLVAKKGRPAILPNKGFFDQLMDLDKELFPDATRPLDIESLRRPTN